MRIHAPVIRGGPLLALLALAATVSPVRGRDALHRYEVNASLRPVVTTNVARGSALSLQARLVASHADSPVQEGAEFALIGKLARAPLGCGSDTIFVDGFDLSG